MGKMTNHKKAENVKIQEQKKYLQQLLLDMQLLFNLARSSLEDRYQRDNIEQIMIELKAFIRILNAKEEYSIEQVNQLATRINEITNMFAKVKADSDVLDLARKRVEEVTMNELGKMYQGQNPLQMLNVEFDVKPDFIGRMKDLGKVCQKIEEDLELLKQHSLGHKYAKVETVAHACKKALNAIHSFFNLGIQLAKELQYYGNRALIISNFKVETPSDALEKDERRKLMLQEELRQLDARIVGTQLQLAQKREQAHKVRPSAGKTKAKQLNENQKEIINLVLADIQRLSALSMACLDKDSEEYLKLQDLQIELNTFNKMLERDQEFTDSQVESLVSIVSNNTKMFKNMQSTQDVINIAQHNIAQKANYALAKMNKGENPIINQTIKLQLAPDFTKQMLEMAQCARQLETHVNMMQKLFPARQYSLYDKLANAALSAKRALGSFFKLGMTLANEAQYYGKRALIVSGFKVSTPHDNLERLAREQAHLQARARQVDAERLGTMQQMEEERHKKSKQRPKIFKG